MGQHRSTPRLSSFPRQGRGVNTPARVLGTPSPAGAVLSCEELDWDTCDHGRKRWWTDRQEQGDRWTEAGTGWGTVLRELVLFFDAGFELGALRSLGRTSDSVNSSITGAPHPTGSRIKDPGSGGPALSVSPEVPRPCRLSPPRVTLQGVMSFPTGQLWLGHHLDRVLGVPGLGTPCARQEDRRLGGSRALRPSAAMMGCLSPRDPRMGNSTW